MRVLGIETSCDETAVSLIEASGDFCHDFSYTVLGNSLLSQAALHAGYGGVFPNLAKREHAKNLVPLLIEVLRQAGALRSGDMIYHIDAELLSREPELLAAITPFLATYQKPAIDAIAVTAGPGLEPALWVGINFAKTLSLAWDIPLVAVNHMEGHIVMSLVRDGRIAEAHFPHLSLLISGGHTELIVSKSFGEYERIGETRDDAVGEAFDKTARLLGLGYPGGPEISRLAEEARREDLPHRYDLPRGMRRSGDYDFSFSGLKTAVRTIVTTFPDLGESEKKILAREFEDAVADVLVEKTVKAVEEYGARTLLVGGGVSANTHIRKRLEGALSEYDPLAKLLAPPPALATDNALMIALAGYFSAMKNEYTDPASLSANGNLRL